MSRIPVIIDCDPGYDDALAITLALGSEAIDVKAITTVAGNVGIDHTYNNARRLCKFLKYDMTIGMGASTPLVRDFHPAPNVHSSTGMSGVTLPDVDPVAKPLTALEVMKSTLENSESKMTLVLIGPVTNAATLLIAYPELKNKISQIVIMGGAAVGGNVTYAAEFNIYVDAEAAKIVFESGIHIVMAGLDITNDFQIIEDDFEGYLEKGRLGKFVYESLNEYYKFYKTLGPRFKGPALHDMLPIAYLIKPELFKGKDYHVEIECKGELTYGQTVVDFLGKHPDKNVHVLSSFQDDEVIEIFHQALENLNKRIS